MAHIHVAGRKEGPARLCMPRIPLLVWRWERAMHTYYNKSPKYKQLISLLCFALNLTVSAGQVWTAGIKALAGLQVSSWRCQGKTCLLAQGGHWQKLLPAEGAVRSSLSLLPSAGSPSAPRGCPHPLSGFPFCSAAPVGQLSLMLLNSPPFSSAISLGKVPTCKDSCDYIGPIRSSITISLF